jgi:K+-sensing histidine kinase KdpD
MDAPAAAPLQPPAWVLVVLDPGHAQLRRLIRRGQRIAHEIGGQLRVVDVQTPRDSQQTRSIERNQRVHLAWEYALSEGLRVDRVGGSDWADTLLGFARSEGCLHLVLGHERRGFGMGIWSIQNLRRLLDGATGLDIHILSFPE